MEGVDCDPTSAKRIECCDAVAGVYLCRLMCTKNEKPITHVSSRMSHAARTPSHTLQVPPSPHTYTQISPGGDYPPRHGQSLWQEVRSVDFCII